MQSQCRRRLSAFLRSCTYGNLHSRCSSTPRSATLADAPTLHRDFCRTSIAASQGRPPESIFCSSPDWDFLQAIPDSNERYSATGRHRPRQSMTARESSAFDEMFATIFEAVEAHEKAATVKGESSPLSEIGVGRGDIDDLIGKMRKFPRRLKPVRQVDEAFDKKKEEIDLCNTDHELLQWASREVFGESERYEAEARKAISQASSSGSPADLPAALQPSAYSLSLAYLMKSFRDKYHDPHLAFAMFNHARHLSIASYVFGCSTPAYNELIETRWKCFRDLRGVLDTLEEMKINAVKVNGQTRKIVESIRREIGEQSLGIENPGFGCEETWSLLTRVEEIMSTSPKNPVLTRTPKTIKSIPWDAWKRTRLRDTDEDSWGFNQWNVAHRNGHRKPRRMLA